MAGKRVLIESMSLGSEEQENAVTQVRAGSCHYDKNNELILIKAGVGCIGIQQMKASGSRAVTPKAFGMGIVVRFLNLNPP